MMNMKPEEDAFGQMVLAQYTGIESFEAMERDDGYIDVGDPKLYFSEWKDWAPFEQRSMYFPNKEEAKKRITEWCTTLKSA